MYSVWQEKEKLQREVANLELQLKMKTKIAELDKQIQLQVWRTWRLHCTLNSFAFFVGTWVTSSGFLDEYRNVCRN